MRKELMSLFFAFFFINHTEAQSVFVSGADGQATIGLTRQPTVNLSPIELDKIFIGNAGGINRLGISNVPSVTANRMSNHNIFISSADGMCSIELKKLETLGNGNLSLEISYPSYSLWSDFYSKAPLYAQSKLLIQIRIISHVQIDPPFKNIKIEAYLDDTPMDLHLNSDIYRLDANNDGLIDTFPSIPYDNFVEFIATSPNDFRDEFEDRNIVVKISSIDGNEVNITKSAKVSMYLANQPTENRCYSNAIDSYRFRNPTSLSFNEFKYYILSSGTTNLPSAALTIAFYELLFHDGRCFGMASTAGQYFLMPETKPIEGIVHNWSESSPLVMDNINRSFIVQLFYLRSFTKSGSSYDKIRQYGVLKSVLSGKKPAVLGLKSTIGDIGHAVLATKLEVFNNEHAYIHLYDSNEPFDTNSLAHRNSGEASAHLNLLDTTFFYPGYDLFTVYTPDQYVRTSISTAYSTFVNTLLDDLNGFKLFGIACPVYGYVENDMGNRVGILSNGSVINEIPSSKIIRVPSGNAENDSLTLIYVPDTYLYNAQLNSYDEGHVYFERVEKKSENQISSAFVESVKISSTSIIHFNEQFPNVVTLDYDGNGTIDSTINTIQLISDANPMAVENVVRNFDLLQNYPNPFNPSTTISYQIPEKSLVTLKVYDILGRQLIVLENNEKNVGRYDVSFNANGLSSGVYFYKMEAQSEVSNKHFTKVGKMILLK
jgi:hypothetical protein